MKRYQPIFEAVARHLETLSIEPEITPGDPVTLEDLERLEAFLGLALPVDVRDYLLELGDGFDFCFWLTPPHEKGSRCWSWSMHCIDEIRSCYDGMRQDIPLDLLNGKDLTTRLKWIPIWGKGDGGYLFCAESESGIIKFHDIRGGASMVIADGLHDWVASWARYCFSGPFYDNTTSPARLNSYVWGKTGKFDWCESRFDPVYQVRK